MRVSENMKFIKIVQREVGQRISENRKIRCNYFHKSAQKFRKFSGEISSQKSMYFKIFGKPSWELMQTIQEESWLNSLQRSLDVFLVF